jgi:hypothetical protein
MRKQLGRAWLACVLLVAAQASPAAAGMAAPLPVHWREVLRLNDTPLMRLQALSFFLLGFVVCALIVRWLWNSLAGEFPKLPRLSLVKALAGVMLWSMLMIIVLTMISGARELMTPGAWKKQSFTYKLAESPATPGYEDPAAVRKQHLERLRTALWQFAALHQGRFPTRAESDAMSPDLWEVPEGGGMRYGYVPGRSADRSAGLLVYEPELEADNRFVIQTNGEIVSRRSLEITLALKAEARHP